MRHSRIYSHFTFAKFRDFVIASLDEIAQNISEFDLLIVDEAHRLVHDSENADVLARLVKVSKHVLFLSATPRVHGDLEFLKMIQILGSTTQDFIEPSVFQSKRSELGLAHFRQLEAVIVSDKFEWLLNFLRKMIATTPKEKVFLIGSQAADIIALTRQLREKLGEHFAIFHEDMTLVERDKQAAYFSDLDGAQFLVSSEIGGEGRNFQFCHHLVLLDIPKDPLIVEQRIGRLDRIGQTQKVRVWCPVLEEDPEESAFEILRDKYKVFEKAWSGAGLVDLKESDLMDTQNKKQDLEQLQKKGKFNKINFNKEEAATLVNSLNSFGSVDIREFLDSLYDLFGIEVEDFDTRGNWRVFSSSLMFVDYFPGLGESGERVLTFDRSQALAREDMTFFTLDHPDFIVCLEFLINSEEGRLALATLPFVEKTDLYFESLQKVEGRQEVTTQAWSYAQKKEVILEAKQIQKAQALKPEMLPDAFMNSLPVALQGFLTKAEELDALLVLIQAKLN